MKTDVVLKSSDRNLFGVTIRQNTKEQFLSVTDLQKAYEVARWQYGWHQQNITSLLNGKETQERIYYLLKERDLIKLEISSFMEMIKNEGFTTVLKGLNLYKTTGKGSDKVVMCDPYIWVLIAMEMNPMLYAKVIIWITDTLIFDRIDAGDEFMPMNAAIKSVIPSPNYPIYNIAINKKVFGHHQSGMRNLASAKELRKITDIEKFVTNAINNGWLKNQEDILKAIETYGN